MTSSGASIFTFFKHPSLFVRASEIKRKCILQWHPVISGYSFLLPLNTLAYLLEHQSWRENMIFEWRLVGLSHKFSFSLNTLAYLHEHQR